MYWIGWDLNYVRLASTAMWIVRKSDDVYLLEVLKRLRWNLEKNVLSPETIQGLDDWIKQLDKYEDGKKLGLMDAAKLAVVCGIWADRVEAELRNLPVLRLDKSLTLRFDLLQDGAKGFFEEDVWNELSELSRNDLNEAARCLVCDIPTASAMIGLRATEDVLRDYYERKTGMKPGKKGWKPIINDLMTEKEHGKLKYSVKKSLMGHLDFVRTNRNEVEHPDRTFSKREAEGVFYQVVGTINEICQDMRKEKSGGSGKG